MATAAGRIIHHARRMVLEHVLGNIIGPELTATETEQHRSVPMEDFAERRVVARFDIAFEQVAVAARHLGLGQHSLEQVRYRTDAHAHDLFSLVGRRAFHNNVAAAGGKCSDFCPLAINRVELAGEGVSTLR